ncbi:MAG TPA: nitrilase-related carbon-nitrogen hydrolase [Candidatus Nanoarchaeia archaeon]|nr:nitrilase-related carbon-nitrogen hydrolase [Candidatus Nanoarchaeia archaeon]
MKIAIAQTNPKVGDLENNTKKIISLIRKTKADIIVFPELSITGYSPQDLLLNKNFVNKNLECLNLIVGSTKNKAVVVGFVERDNLNNSFIYNSAAVIKDGQIIAVHRKVCLPNYTVFDEKRWFSKGNDATVFELNGKRIGVNICEDIWFSEIAKMQKEKGAEIIINLSASPYRSGKTEKIESVIGQRWNETGIPIIFVNQTGSQDGIVYYGHSLYFKDGKVIKKCRDFEEDMIIVEV